MKEDIDLGVEDLYYIEISDSSDTDGIHGEKSYISLGSNAIIPKMEIASPESQCSIDDSLQSEIKINQDSNNYFGKDADNLVKLYCPECLLITEIMNEMDFHLCQECSTPLKYICMKCSDGFNSLELYIEHQNNSCCTEKKFYCEHCTFVTNIRKRFTKHLRRKHTYDECPECKVTFRHQCFNVHRRVCGKVPRFKCNQCSYVAKCEYYLNRHVRRVHIKCARVACPKCSRTFKNSSNLRRHLKLVCNLRKRQYLCEHCTYSCYCRTYMVSHMKYKHPRLYPQNEYTCDSCGRVYYIKRDIVYHIMKEKCFED